MQVWVLGMLACFAVPAFAGTLEVQVSGQVSHPGAQSLPEDSRLSDAVLKAGVLPTAYLLGAAWLRSSLHETQVRWKAGLMYEVGLLQGQARLEGKPALTALATRLKERWHALPVTGRQRRALLDPRPLEISDQNHLLASGDRIVYPPRPTTVRVLGAVTRPCTLTFTPMQTARRYAASCAHSAGADPDWLYVIQPDGSVTRRGIALWNRQPGRVLAPGAVVYVPITPRLLPDSIREDFNHDAARFLSTQVLPSATGAGR